MTACSNSSQKLRHIFGFIYLGFWSRLVYQNLFKINLKFDSKTVVILKFAKSTGDAPKVRFIEVYK